jgi:hypothetical protein
MDDATVGVGIEGGAAVERRAVVLPPGLTLQPGLVFRCKAYRANPDGSPGELLWEDDAVVDRVWEEGGDVGHEFGLE